MSLNREWVAAGTLRSTTTYKNANLKYKNPYTTTKSSLPGDATIECSGWHNTGTSVSSGWFRFDSNTGLLRAYSGSIFSFFGYSSTDADYAKPWASRAVVVLGSGI